MNIVTKNILILITVASIFQGCQKEITEIIQPPTDKVFTSQSDVATLMQRTSMNDGSGDNIIDMASCTKLVLPVTITVNSTQLTINSSADFVTVEHILDENDDDADEIKFRFPITAVLPDFSKVVFSNEDQWKNFVDKCDENSPDDDIECVDFEFPLTLSIYNADNQVSDVITIDNDEKLYHFLDDMDENEYASFTFPIKVTLSDNTELTINSNSELEDVIKNADGTCDEDDDNDHNDDDIDDSSLVTTLTSGQWKISYFFNEKDETSGFAGYVQTFMANGTVSAVKGATTVSGEWETDGEIGTLELKLHFESNQLFGELSDNWEVIEFSNTSIKLKDVSGGDGSVSYLTLTKL